MSASPRPTHYGPPCGLLLCALCLSFPVASAAAPETGLKASARVKFIVTIPQVLRWERPPGAHALTLASEDVARGVVEWQVDDLRVISNLGQGFQLAAEPAERWIAAIEVEPVALRGSASSGAWPRAPDAVEIRGLGAIRLSVRLRLRLAPGARPGQVSLVPVLWRLQPI